MGSVTTSNRNRPSLNTSRGVTIHKDTFSCDKISIERGRRSALLSTFKILLLEMNDRKKLYFSDCGKVS